MAKDDIGGVWRTVGGRRIFIKDGQDLATAMKESGKFKKSKNQKSDFYKKLSKEDKEKYDNYLKQGYTQKDIEDTLMYKTQEDRMRKAGIKFASKEETKGLQEKANKVVESLKENKKTTYKEDLPHKTEIKSQGTSNRKEVSENIQAHILEHYDNPQDFIDQMDAMDYLPTKWRAGEELAKGGSYLIYNEDMQDFLNELKINPKGKKFSDDKAFSMYTSLIGRESEKLYNRLQKNAFQKYLKEHPGSKMSFEDFKDMRK